MRRTVQRLLENPLSECLLDGFAKDGDEVTVAESGGTVVLSNSRGDSREYSLEELGSGSGGIEEGERMTTNGASSSSSSGGDLGGGGLPLPGAVMT